MSSWQPRPAHPVRLLRTLYTGRTLHRLQLRTHGLWPWHHRHRRAQLLRQAALHVSCDVTAHQQQQQRRRQRRRLPPGPHSAPACQVYLPERWGNWISPCWLDADDRLCSRRSGRRLPIPLSLALNGFLTASNYATSAQCALSGLTAKSCRREKLLIFSHYVSFVRTTFAILQALKNNRWLLANVLDPSSLNNVSASESSDCMALCKLVLTFYLTLCFLTLARRFVWWYFCLFFIFFSCVIFRYLVAMSSTAARFNVWL